MSNGIASTARDSELLREVSNPLRYSTSCCEHLVRICVDLTTHLHYHRPVNCIRVDRHKHCRSAENGQKQLVDGALKLAK